jgi:hypothetical protein
MLSWSTSGIGRENANGEFGEAEELGAGRKQFVGVSARKWTPDFALPLRLQEASSEQARRLCWSNGERTSWTSGPSGKDRGSVRDAVFEYRCLQIRQDEQKITPGFWLAGDKVDHLGAPITPCERAV